jgi:hypothetical protein
MSAREERLWRIFSAVVVLGAIFIAMALAVWV